MSTDIKKWQERLDQFGWMVHSHGAVGGQTAQLQAREAEIADLRAALEASVERQAYDALAAERDRYKSALEAVQPAAQQGDGELPPLPRPACTYADHSYPAFNKVQMAEYARAYGEQRWIAGRRDQYAVAIQQRDRAEKAEAALAQRAGSGGAESANFRTKIETEPLGKGCLDGALPGSERDAALSRALAEGYEGGAMVDQDLAGMVTLHYVSPSHAESAFEAINNAIAAQQGEKGEKS